MRSLLIGSAAVALLIALAAPQRSEACSISDDRVDPPEVERPYDPAESPSKPVVVSARISTHGQTPGCGGDDCGPFSGLSLTLQVDPGITLVRIDFADRPHIYARLWEGSGGNMYLFVPGYDDADAIDLTIHAIDTDGYTSQAVNARAEYDDPDDDGCSASGSQSSALLVLFAGLLVAMRRRRRI